MGFLILDYIGLDIWTGTEAPPPKMRISKGCELLCATKLNLGTEPINGYPND
jgi:hypothetical protein